MTRINRTDQLSTCQGYFMHTNIMFLIRCLHCHQGYSAHDQEEIILLANAHQTQSTSQTKSIPMLLFRSTLLITSILEQNQWTTRKTLKLEQLSEHQKFFNTYKELPFPRGNGQQGVYKSKSNQNIYVKKFCAFLDKNFSANFLSNS